MAASVERTYMRKKKITFWKIQKTRCRALLEGFVSIFCYRNEKTIIKYNEFYTKNLLGLRDDVPLFARRKVRGIWKIIALLIGVWWLINYGFDQGPGSDFGEHLDRNRIEEIQLRIMEIGQEPEKKSHDEELTLNTHDQMIMEEFLNKLAMQSDHKSTEAQKNKEQRILDEFFSKLSATPPKRKPTKAVVEAKKAPETTKSKIATTQAAAPKEKATDKHREEPKLVLESSSLEATTKINVATTPSAIVKDKSPEKPKEEPRKEKPVNETVIMSGKVKRKDPIKDLAESWRPRNIFETEDLGEQGVPVLMPQNLSTDIKKLYDEGWKKNEFNQYLSDLISLHRSLPDLRSDHCLDKKYSKNLPKTSVIIIFRNEAWSTLLRTVHSVLDRSPKDLIEEIILVDDFSDMDHLKEPLDDYIDKLPKVKIIRAVQRAGLIRARLMGAMIAEGPVLTFLDSHIECTEGWLEPLLDRIAADPTNVVCPILHTISAKTFQFQSHFNPEFMQVGGFDWDLAFRWFDVPESEKLRKESPWEPTRSATMPGGIFSIDKAFFYRLGMYDPEFDIWGGENLEISFKTWMCGGSLEFLPCSHVGHVFRSRSPYDWGPESNVLRRNLIRLAEVWMDEYAQYYYDRGVTDKGDYGDITDRVKLRKDLGCKSFKWYVENVYPELRIPGDTIAHGEIRNFGYGSNKCLDAPNDRENGNLSVRTCRQTGGSQYWEYLDGLLRKDYSCVEFNPKSPELKLTHCKAETAQKYQIWTFRNDSKQFHHRYADKCLEMTKDFRLVMEVCDDNAEGQRWQPQHVNLQMLKEFL